MITLQFAYIALVTAILGVTAAQLLIKARFSALGIAEALGHGLLPTILMMLRDWPLWVALVLMLTGAVLWYLAMAKLPLHFILPCAAIIAPLASIGAWLWLGEAISLPKMLAIGLIALGVAWLGLLQARG